LGTQCSAVSKRSGAISVPEQNAAVGCSSKGSPGHSCHSSLSVGVAFNAAVVSVRVSALVSISAAWVSMTTAAIAGGATGS
jgi:hypothetical protein